MPASRWLAGMLNAASNAVLMLPDSRALIGQLEPTTIAKDSLLVSLDEDRPQSTVAQALAVGVMGLATFRAAPPCSQPSWLYCAVSVARLVSG